MAIGPDGHGWIGHDKNGRTIYKSDAELRREAEQARADARRGETLYVSDKHKVFFITRQPADEPGVGDNGRLAYIAVRPFATLGPDALKELNEKAEPWNESSWVHIYQTGTHLVLRDDITGTQTNFDAALLDPETYREKFNQVAGNGAWAKYTANPVPPKPLRISFQL